MFEQHPVPQQISSYQFRLVGDMTLKQFFQVAGGCVVGLLLYASPLPSIFKWPLIILAVVAGAAFAFLPLQERPLSEWLAAFFRAVYGPTIFTWKKTNEVESFFLQTQSQSELTTTPTTPVLAKPAETPTAKLDAFESKFLSSVTGIFGSVRPNTAPTQVAQTEPQAPAKVITQVTEAPKVNDIKQAPTRPAVVMTPQPPVVKVETKQPGFEVQPEPISSPVTTSSVQSVFKETNQVNSTPAVFEVNAAPPTPSTMPNIIVGQITTNDGKIIEGAIMEVKDFQGRPVRALKTNKLGHFMIVTPLPSGSYTLTIEKEGYTFDSVSIEVHGVVVPPILIKAKQ